jgi:hypothetical protein
LASQREWPLDRDPRRGFVLVPGIREKIGRSFAGPLRPGVVDVGGAVARGAVADDSRESDLGMDRLRRPMDAIGKKYPETDPPAPLLGKELTNVRRSTRGRED